jgi:hypothetical protein
MRLFLIIIYFQGALIFHYIYVYNVVNNNGKGVNSHPMTKKNLIP